MHWYGSNSLTHSFIHSCYKYLLITYYIFILNTVNEIVWPNFFFLWCFCSYRHLGPPFKPTCRQAEPFPCRNAEVLLCNYPQGAFDLMNLSILPLQRYFKIEMSVNLLKFTPTCLLRERVKLLISPLLQGAWGTTQILPHLRKKQERFFWRRCLGGFISKSFFFGR